MNQPWKRKEVIGLLDGVTFDGFEPVVWIYAIEGDTPVYVGSTSQTIKSRIRAHVGDARTGSNLPIHAWIRSQGFKFKVRMLDRVTEGERVKFEKKWCAALGPDLLNITDGGPGMSGHRFSGSAHAQAIAEKLKTGAHFDCIECGSQFWRKLRDIKKCHNKFCSRACYQDWQRGRPKKRASV